MLLIDFKIDIKQSNNIYLKLHKGKVHFSVAQIKNTANKMQTKTKPREKEYDIVHA